MFHEDKLQNKAKKIDVSPICPVHNRVKDHPMNRQVSKYILGDEMLFEQLTQNDFESITQLVVEGEIAETIGNFEYLTELTIKNVEECILPASIGNLTQLELLRFENCTGIVLPDTTLNLTHLKSLEFSQSDIEKIPDGVDDAWRITTFRYTDSVYETFPSEIEKFFQNYTGKLTYLDFTSNKLTKLTSAFKNAMAPSAGQVVVMDFSNNKIVAIDDTLEHWVLEESANYHLYIRDQEIEGYVGELIVEDIIIGVSIIFDNPIMYIEHMQDSHHTHFDATYNRATNTYTLTNFKSMTRDVKEINHHIKYLLSHHQTTSESGIWRDGRLSIRLMLDWNNTPPVILASNREIMVGDVFDPLVGVYVTDDYDTIELLPEHVIENTVDVYKPGIYSVTYSVEDSDGARTTEHIHVAVQEEPHGGITGKPVITATNVTLEQGSIFNPLIYAKAYDREDGEIIPKIEQNTVNTSVTGTYFVIYTATNSDCNVSTKIISVQVVRKGKRLGQVRPVISVEDITLFVDDAFNPIEHGLVYDCKEGIIEMTEDNIAYSSVDTTEPGEYTVIYQAKNGKGIEADPATITVYVQEPLKHRKSAVELNTLPPFVCGQVSHPVVTETEIVVNDDKSMDAEQVLDGTEDRAVEAVPEEVLDSTEDRAVEAVPEEVLDSTEDRAVEAALVEVLDSTEDSAKEAVPEEVLDSTEDSIKEAVLVEVLDSIEDSAVEAVPKEVLDGTVDRVKEVVTKKVRNEEVGAVSEVVQDDINTVAVETVLEKVLDDVEDEIKTSETDNAIEHLEIIAEEPILDEMLQDINAMLEAHEVLEQQPVVVDATQELTEVSSSLEEVVTKESRVFDYEESEPSILDELMAVHGVQQFLRNIDQEKVELETGYGIIVEETSGTLGDVISGEGERELFKDLKEQAADFTKSEGYVQQSLEDIEALSQPVVIIPNRVIFVDDVYDPLEGIHTLDGEIRIIENTIKTHTAGVYDLIYEVVNYVGSRSTQIAYVIVQEKNHDGKDGKPVITAVNVTLSKGQNFDHSLYAKAFSRDNGVSMPLVCEHVVNTNNVGEYYVTYSVTTNDMVSKKIIVVTVVDEQLDEVPQIPVIMAENITLWAGTVFNPLDHVIAYSQSEGILTLTEANIAYHNVDLDTPGEYTVIYKVEDSKGLAAHPKTLTVFVQESPDVSAKATPKNAQIDLFNEQIEKPFTRVVQNTRLTVGDTFNPLDCIHIATNQNEDTKINHVTVLENTVQTDKVGLYKVTYEVIASDGHHMTQDISVVVEDQAQQHKNERPVISAIDVILRKGMSFEPSQYAIAYDLEDGFIIPNIEENTVNTKSIGNYYVTFSAINSRQNTVAKTIMVTVIEGTTNVAHFKPIIVASDVTLYQGGHFNALDHAIAYDAHDGLLKMTEKDNIAYNSVNTMKVGSYSVIYRVENSNGLEAEAVSITVVVQQSRKVRKETPSTPKGKEDVYLKYMGTYPDGKFKATKGIAREEFVQMVTSLLLDRELKPTANRALDESTKQFYSQYTMAFLMDNGILMPTGDSPTRAQEPVSRAEVAVVLAKLNNLGVVDSKEIDECVDKTHWAYHTIQQVIEQGGLSGYHNTMIKSYIDMERTDIDETINTTYRSGYVFDESAYAIPFTNIPTLYWAYEDVLRKSGI